MKRFLIMLAAVFAAMVFSNPQNLLAADNPAPPLGAKKPTAPDPAGLKKPAMDDPKWLLDMTQDKVSMDEKIAAYIAKIHKVSAKPLFNKKTNDLFLVYELAPPKAPKMPVFVNSRIWGRNPKTKKVISRLIEIKATYVLPQEAKSDAILAKIRKFNDEFMWRRWSPFRVYISPRKNIRMASFIDYGSTAYKIHPEMVFSLLVRMMKNWGIYYNMLIKDVPEARESLKPKVKKPKKAK